MVKLCFQLCIISISLHCYYYMQDLQNKCKFTTQRSYSHTVVHFHGYMDVFCDQISGAWLEKPIVKLTMAFCSGSW